MNIQTFQFDYSQCFRKFHGALSVIVLFLPHTGCHLHWAVLQGKGCGPPHPLSARLAHSKFSSFCLNSTSCILLRIVVFLAGSLHGHPMDPVSARGRYLQRPTGSVSHG
jgi:hypothetical protein